MRALTRAALLLAGLLGLCGCPANETPIVPPAPPAVTVALPVKRAVQTWVTATGSVVATQRVELRAQVSGVLVKRPFEGGELVQGPTDKEPGTLLFQIDPRPYAVRRDRCQANLQQATVARTEAALRLSRLEAALAKKAAPELDVIQQRATVDRLDAELAGLKADLAAAELDLQFAELRAPITGRVSKPLVSVGDLIRPGAETLTTIVSVAPTFVDFTITERELLEVRARYPKGAHEVPVHVGLVTDKGYPTAGTLTYIDTGVDQSTGTLSLRATFENKDEGLRDGMFCRVRVPVGDAQEKLLVADRAVGTDQGQKYLLVVEADGKAAYRPVTLGPLDEGLRVIESGLKADEKVIVVGLQRVRPGVPVTATQGEMLTAEGKPDARPGTETETKPATETGDKH